MANDGGAPEVSLENSRDAADRKRVLLVHAQQVQALYGALPTTIAGMTSEGLIVVLALWSVVAHHVLLTWWGIILVLQTTRFWLLLRYRRTQPTPEHARKWATYWTIGAGISGVIWGSSTYFLWVPDSIGHQAFLVIALMAVTTGGVLLVSIYLPAFLVFVIPTTLPMIARVAIAGDPLHLYIAVTCSIVLYFLLRFGCRLNRLLIASLDNELSARTHEAAAEEHLAEAAQQKRLADEARERAEAAAQAKSKFFEAVSHDLRQPLQAMLLLGGLIADRVKQPEVVELVRKTKQGADALGRLFKELMDISKIDSHAITPQIDSVALQTIFNNVRTTFEPEAFSRGIELRVAPTRAVVCTDAVMLERIVRNLVSNALKYTAHGGVLVGCRRCQGNYRIEVWDTGIGIPVADQQLIFEEFYQIGNPAGNSEKGMGLGLALVQRLAKLLQHPISVASRTSKGSTFTVTVPKGRTLIDTKTASDVAPRSHNFSGKLVVVIDDEAVIVQALQATLKRWGCAVVGAANGRDAIAELKQRNLAPDLVIVDYRLDSNEDGFSVIADLREHFGNDIAAILLSGTTTAELSFQAECRGLRLVQKPIGPGQLRALLSFVLQPRAVAAE